MQGLTFEDADLKHPFQGTEAQEKRISQILRRWPERCPKHVVYAWYCPKCRKRISGEYKSKVLSEKTKHLARHRK